MPTKTQNGIRDRILEAALTVLQEEGPLALTQPRVARNAGVAQGHLTYYFPTRSDLLAAVAEATTAALLAEYDGLIAVAAAGTTEPAAAVAASLHSAKRTRLLLGFVLAADAEPAIRAMFRDLTAAVRERLLAALAQARLPADSAAVAMLHALCVGLAVLDLARGEAAATAEIATGLTTAQGALRSRAPQPRRKTGTSARRKGR